MKNLDYFKKQAKYLVKDWETRKENPGTDEDWDGEPYVYDGVYFEMYNMVHYYEIGDDFCLQKAQHIIAQMAGYKKWDDLQNADEDELSLARIRFLHQDPSTANGWERYCKTIKWDLIPVEARFPIIKSRMYNCKNDFLMSKQFVGEILHGKEKDVALQDELDMFPDRSDPDATVECIHCGQKFQNKEVNVIHQYGFGISGEQDLIVCKNYPKCTGTLIDLMLNPES